jgi:hypothetical protein
VWHLIRRFFGYLRAAPLTPHEQDLVADALAPRLSALFYRQPTPDQRHAFEVALRVKDTLPADADAFTAALLHDVGKTTASLGPVARSLATVLAALGLPMSSRWASYRDHGRLGAEALRAAGAPDLAVAFSRHHPGPVPDGVDATVWHALEAADDA